MINVLSSQRRSGLMDKCHSLHFLSCSPHQKSLQERGFSLCHPTQWASSPQAVKFSFKMCFQHFKDRTREMHSGEKLVLMVPSKRRAVNIKHMGGANSHFCL